MGNYQPLRTVVVMCRGALGDFASYNTQEHLASDLCEICRLVMYCVRSCSLFRTRCSSPIIWDDFGENEELDKTGKGLDDSWCDKPQQIRVEEIRVWRLVLVELEEDVGHLISRGSFLGL